MESCSASRSPHLPFFFLNNPSFFLSLFLIFCLLCLSLETVFIYLVIPSSFLSFSFPLRHSFIILFTHHPFLSMITYPFSAHLSIHLSILLSFPDTYTVIPSEPSVHSPAHLSMHSFFTQLFLLALLSIH